MTWKICDNCGKRSECVCVKPSPKLVPLGRTEIAFMVQEIISAAHSRPEGAEMIDLIDKYESKFGVPNSGMVPLDEQGKRLWKIIRNSTLWDSCVLEAYEGDVGELIENILFAGFRFGVPDSGLVGMDNIIKEAMNDLTIRSWGSKELVENNIKVCSLNTALSWLSKISRFGTPSPALTVEDIIKLIKDSDMYTIGVDKKTVNNLAQAILARMKGEK